MAFQSSKCYGANLYGFDFLWKYLGAKEEDGFQGENNLLFPRSLPSVSLERKKRKKEKGASWDTQTRKGSFHGSVTWKMLFWQINAPWCTQFLHLHTPFETKFLCLFTPLLRLFFPFHTPKKLNIWKWNVVHNNNNNNNNKNNTFLALICRLRRR